MTDADLVRKKLAQIETCVAAVVKDILANHLGDLTAFVAAIRAILTEET